MSEQPSASVGDKRRREQDDGYHKPKRVFSEEDAINSGSFSRGKFDRDRSRGSFGGRGRGGKSWGQRGGGYLGKNQQGQRQGQRAPREKKEKVKMSEEEMMNAMAGGSAATPTKKEGEVEGAVKEEGEEGDKEKRLPKKRAAVLVGYCGTGYHGMQM